MKLRNNLLHFYSINLFKLITLLIVDHKFLQEALDASDKFLKSINETVRLKENEERLEWLQEYVQNDLNIKFNSCTNKLGSRKLLHYGTLTKVLLKQRYLYQIR